jgi:hypothetical protein
MYRLKPLLRLPGQKDTDQEQYQHQDYERPDDLIYISKFKWLQFFLRKNSIF